MENTDAILSDMGLSAEILKDLHHNHGDNLDIGVVLPEVAVARERASVEMEMSHAMTDSEVTSSPVLDAAFGLSEEQLEFIRN